MSDQQPPEFVHIDAQAITQDLINRYETKTGKTLYPAQIERLFIDLVAYAHVLKLSAIQSSAEKMLVRFSNGSILDYLGDLVGTPRLLPTFAKCDIQFKLNDPEAGAVTVPAGTLISNSVGDVTFAIDKDLTLVDDTPQIVQATCTETGSLANDWEPGKITELESSLPVSAANINSTSGGADIEDDERYKERIILAPEAYSNAGSYGAYKYYAMAAHQSIVDVSVFGPSEGTVPGTVELMPLTTDGMPSQLILDLVKQKTSAETVRPLCDTVNVYSPEKIDYEVIAELTFYADTDTSQTEVVARQSLDIYLKSRQVKLGADLIPTQISAALHVKGIYKVNIVSPVLTEITNHQWANCTGVTLVNMGQADG